MKYQITWLDTRKNERKSLTVNSQRAMRDIIVTLESVRPGEAVDIAIAYIEAGRINNAFTVWFERE